MFVVMNSNRPSERQVHMELPTLGEKPNPEKFCDILDSYFCICLKKSSINTLAFADENSQRSSKKRKRKEK